MVNLFNLWILLENVQMPFYDLLYVWPSWIILRNESSKSFWHILGLNYVTAHMSDLKYPTSLTLHLTKISIIFCSIISCAHYFPPITIIRTSAHLIPTNTPPIDAFILSSCVHNFLPLISAKPPVQWITTKALVILPLNTSANPLVTSRGYLSVIFFFKFTFMLNFAPLNIILSFLRMKELVKMLNFHHHTEKKYHEWSPRYCPFCSRL